MIHKIIEDYYGHDITSRLLYFVWIILEQADYLLKKSEVLSWKKRVLRKKISMLQKQDKQSFYYFF